jgi:hypothetical protein
MLECSVELRLLLHHILVCNALHQDLTMFTQSAPLHFPLHFGICLQPTLSLFLFFRIVAAQPLVGNMESTHRIFQDTLHPVM